MASALQTRVLHWRWHWRAHGRRVRLLLVLLLGMLLAPSLAAQAVDPLPFKNRSEEARFQRLTAQLRCLVCQNEKPGRFQRQPGARSAASGVRATAGRQE